MSARMQLDALTSLRGIAAWWVVLYHFREGLPAHWPAFLASTAAYGYLAVDLFFILSGFVISLNYSQQFRNGVRGSFTFYGMRLARIYPLHLLVMILYLSVPVAVALFSSQGLQEGELPVGYYLQSLLLIQNWGFTDRLLWNVPAWSISTEMFAYLIFPLVAFGVSRFVTGLTAALSYVLLLLLLLAGLAAALVPSIGDDIEHFGLIRCVLEFSIGIGLHRIIAFHPARHPLENSAGLLLFLACAAAFALGLAPDYILMPFGFFCLIYALADPGGSVARLLSTRVLIFVGAISYSTYLVHYLVKTWVKFLLVQPGIPELVPLLAYLAVTAVASWVLYQRVEIPAQRWCRGIIARLSAPKPAIARYVDTAGPGPGAP
ncbi:acyltransferase family protein [Roseomonas marmotae]|uniref:Acyltransferase n=1 Tax=Roseomonas marmotae TaxID=2768161 RepID=A0ABS3KHR5_9PROT|nr:acyltransferase [Roseomonas marmotae]MBO1076977.1 acyltransferase [Roseomonas marmotae]QTI80064.1 acyltransferase [Roseomonas marmotae]